MNESVCALAVETTENESEVAVAPAAVVTTTLSEELVEVTGDQPSGLARASALVTSAATLALRSCMLLTAVSWVVTWVLRRLCGTASSCMSWEMMVAVSRPLARPPMLALPATAHSLLVRFGWRMVWHRAGAESLDSRPGLGVQLCCGSARSAEQGQDALGRLVGLRQHRGAGLGQDLRAGEVHHLLRHVGVADPALGGGEVLDRHVEVVDGVLEAVLDRTELGALGRDALDGGVDRGEVRGRWCSRSRPAPSMPSVADVMSESVDDVCVSPPLAPTWKVRVLVPSSSLVPLNSVRVGDAVDLGRRAR